MGLKAIQDYYEYFLGNMKMFTQKQIKIEKIDANSSMEGVLYKAELIMTKDVDTCEMNDSIGQQSLQFHDPFARKPMTLVIGGIAAILTVLITRICF